EEIGVRLPEPTPVGRLGPGEVGYLIAGIKDVGQARVGETVTMASRPGEALVGYRDPKPMVFCGLYPVEGDDFADLREALEKLRLNDSSFTYAPETSGALGFGFRCGFLGLLHMEIIRERLEREYDLSLVATAPNVEYLAHTTEGKVELVDNPSSMPPPNKLDFIEEPYVKVTIITPTEYVGALMELAQGRRGDMTNMEYLSENRVELVYELPLAEIVVDFFDQMKSRTRGYASLDYEPAGNRRSELVKVDLLLNNVPVDAFSTIVHRSKAEDYGRKMATKLRTLIPRQLFDVPIQAAIGSRVIARETVKAKRKDVLAKCYGGDITRKRKLLEKQKEGKRKMKMVGRVEVPQEALCRPCASRRTEAPWPGVGPPPASHRSTGSAGWRPWPSWRSSPGSVPPWGSGRGRGTARSPPPAVAPGVGAARPGAAPGIPATPTTARRDRTPTAGRAVAEPAAPARPAVAGPAAARRPPGRPATPPP